MYVLWSTGEDEGMVSENPVSQCVRQESSACVLSIGGQHGQFAFNVMFEHSKKEIEPT